MNAVAKVMPPAGTNIVALVEATPVIVLTDKQKFSEFYEAMRAECDAHVPNLTTDKGRKEIASLAYKVARTKAAIDAAGKQLNEESRARINAVDEARRVIREQLDSLKDEVRAPLTAWENAEEKRVEACDAIMTGLRDVVVVPHEASASDVRERLTAVQARVLNPEILQGFAPQAELLQQQAVATLTFLAEEIEQADAERAELERLRADNAAREAREREEREAREARERAEAEAKAADERRAAAEKAEADRIERVAKEAEDRAKREVEQKASEEAAERQREHNEALAAERLRAEQAEADAQALRYRAAKEDADRKAIADQEAAELVRRESDRSHKAKVMGEAKSAIMTCGADEQTAKAIVLAIVGRTVPHISIQF